MYMDKVDDWGAWAAWGNAPQGSVTNLFAIDPLSLFGYLTVNPTHPVTDNFGC